MLNAINSYQKKSLERTAEEGKVAYPDLIQFLCEQINKFESEARKECSKVYGDDVAKSVFTSPFPIKTEEDFWEYRSHNAKDLLNNCAEIIDDAVNKLRIDLPINYLKDRLECAQKISFDGFTLSEIVRSIPVAVSFEPTFNAAAVLDHPDIRFPHIRHYANAGDSLRAIIFTLVNHYFILTPDQNAMAFLPTKQTTPHSPEDEIYSTIIYLLENTKSGWIFLERSRMPAYCDTLVGVKNHVARLITFCAQISMMLHEIGHHLLGHFDNNSSPFEKEYEADMFAAMCLSQSKIPVMYTFSGITTTYKVIRLISDSVEKHPAPIMRMRRIFQTMKSYIPDIERQEMGCSRMCDILDFLYLEKKGMTFNDARAEILKRD